MPNCKGCKYEKAKLKCLICEQAEELDREKYIPRQFPKITCPDDTPYPELNNHERAVWVLHLSNFTELEIAQFTYISQPAVSLCLARIKLKLKA